MHAYTYICYMCALLYVRAPSLSYIDCCLYYSYVDLPAISYQLPPDACIIHLVRTSSQRAPIEYMCTCVLHYTLCLTRRYCIELYSTCTSFLKSIKQLAPVMNARCYCLPNVRTRCCAFQLVNDEFMDRLHQQYMIPGQNRH